MLIISISPLKMAILNLGHGEVEVSILDPFPVGQEVYYNEYIRFDNMEFSHSKAVERNIACEKGDEFAFEVRLKKGFDFAGYDTVAAKYSFGEKPAIFKKLFFPRQADHEGGIKQDLVYWITNDSLATFRTTQPNIINASKNPIFQNTTPGTDYESQIEGRDLKCTQYNSRSPVAGKVDSLWPKEYCC